jgi:hypothetical protein
MLHNLLLAAQPLLLIDYIFSSLLSSRYMLNSLSACCKAFRPTCCPNSTTCLSCWLSLSVFSYSLFLLSCSVSRLSCSLNALCRQLYSYPKLISSLHNLTCSLSHHSVLLSGQNIKWNVRRAVGNYSRRACAENCRGRTMGGRGCTVHWTASTQRPHLRQDNKQKRPSVSR